MSSSEIVYTETGPTADSINDNLHFQGFLDSLHNKFPLNEALYLWSDSNTYQIQPQKIVHVAVLDSAPGGGNTLTITLPYPIAYPAGGCFFLIYLKAANANDTFVLAPIDPLCSINDAAAGTPLSFTTDGDNHFFLVYGVFNQQTVNAFNNYYVKSLGGRNFNITAGSGISLTGYPNFTINAFEGTPVTFGGATTATTAAEYFGVATTSSNATEANVSGWLVTQPGTIKQLYVNLSANLAVATNTEIVTLRKNAAASVLTCTVANGTKSASDLTHSIGVVPGDYITISSVQTATGEAVKASFAFCFRPSAV